MKPTHILVLQAGWVFVGAMTRGDDLTTLEHASCVRVWGTDKGLGELALLGPRPKTVLDPCGAVQAPNTAVLFFIPVESKKWP